LEVIPRTLSQNCGAEVVRVVTDLRARHSDKTDPNHVFYGVNGHTGVVSNMKDLKVWDTLSVKKQTLKTSVESACMILRIDDIVSGMKKQKKKEINPSQEAQIDNETVNIYFLILVW
jgi:T-complex protein 1 subunit gamma